MKCVECGSVIGMSQRRISVSTGIVLVRPERKFLVMRRLTGAWKGFWTVPGGHVEEGETLLDCAVREVKEETSLDAIPKMVLRHSLVFHVDELMNTQARIHKIMHYVAMEVLGETEPVNREPRKHADLRFVTLQEAGKLRMNELLPLGAIEEFREKIGL